MGTVVGAIHAVRTNPTLPSLRSYSSASHQRCEAQYHSARALPLARRGHLLRESQSLAAPAGHLPNEPQNSVARRGQSRHGPHSSTAPAGHIRREIQKPAARWGDAYP